MSSLIFWNDLSDRQTWPFLTFSIWDLLFQLDFYSNLHGLFLAQPQQAFIHQPCGFIGWHSP